MCAAWAAPWLRFVLTVALAKGLAVLGILLLLRAGQVSFGHAMFLGIGGYTAAHAAKVWGLTPELAILLGAVGWPGVPDHVSLWGSLIKFRREFDQYINLRPVRLFDGVPQGSPLSPLLANLVLDELDQELEARGHRFARYADDVVILVRSERAGHRVLASIARFLERRLKLTVNAEKSQVAPTDQISFLGFSFR